MCHDEPFFTTSGMYIVEQKIDKKKSNLYLGLIIIAVFSLIFYDKWPKWLQEKTYTGFMGCILSYFAIHVGRVAVWLLAYHLGLNLWLFPQYRSSWAPWKFLYPIVEVK